MKLVETCSDLSSVNIWAFLVGQCWITSLFLQHDKYIFYQTHRTCRLIKLFVHITSFLIHPQEVDFLFLSSLLCLLQSTNMTCLGSSSELYHYAACLLSLGRNQRFSLFSWNKTTHLWSRITEVSCQTTTFLKFSSFEGIGSAFNIDWQTCPL